MNVNRRNVTLLFITMVVVMLGFGLVIPILPFYVESMGANGRDLGLLMSVFSLMQLIFAPVWGSLSDKIGRKPVLLIGIFGNAISQLLMGMSTQLWMLYAARALAGILSSATLPTAMAYISDSTSYKDRSGGMGAIGAAMGIGMVLGPGLGGWLAGKSLSAPFFLAAALSAVVWVGVYLILPESLPVEHRVINGKIKAVSVNQLWKSLTGPLGYLMFLSFLMHFGLTNFEGVFGLYALQRYGYKPEQVGTILVVIGIVSSVMQGMMTGPLTKRWGDNLVIQGSLLVSAIGFGWMLFADNFAMVLLTTSFFMVGNALLRPATAALVSRQSNPSEQGSALGMYNSFMSLGRIVGPVWAGSLLDVNLFYPYISGAIVMILGLLTTFIWFNRRVAQPDGDPAILAAKQPGG